MLSESKDCSNCKKEISANARYCIHCKKYQSWFKEKRIGRKIILLVAAVISIVTITKKDIDTFFESSLEYAEYVKPIDVSPSLDSSSLILDIRNNSDTDFIIYDLRLEVHFPLLAKNKDLLHKLKRYFSYEVQAQPISIRLKPNSETKTVINFRKIELNKEFDYLNFKSALSYAYMHTLSEYEQWGSFRNSTRKKEINSYLSRGFNKFQDQHLLNKYYSKYPYTSIQFYTIDHNLNIQFYVFSISNEILFEWRAVYYKKYGR